jgi:serine phosphatase RsbU (regulator of sigma subunit)
MQDYSVGGFSPPEAYTTPDTDALLTLDRRLRITGSTPAARKALAAGSDLPEGRLLRDVVPWAAGIVEDAVRSAFGRRSLSVVAESGSTLRHVWIHPLLEGDTVAGAILSWRLVEGGPRSTDGTARALEKMAVALARVRSTAAAAHVIAEQCMPHLGASSGALALVDDTSQALRIAATHGAGSPYTTGQSLPPDDPSLLCEAVRTDARIVEGSLPRRVAAPLLVGGRVVGAFEVRLGPRGVSDELVGAATALWALALGRARTHEAERAARSSLREATNRMAFLAESTRTLNESLELGETLSRLARLSVPRLGTICGIHLLRGGMPRLTASAHAQPGTSELALAWLKGAGGLIGSEALRAAVGKGIATVVRLKRDGEHRLVTTDEALGTLRALGLGIVAIVPLSVHGRVLGAITLASPRGEGAREPDLVLAEEIGIRAGTAIERAQLYQEQTHAIRQLQADLLPPKLPDVPGLDLGSVFVPATRFGDVGGDFYDVVVLRDGRVLLVIGDVQGKGLPAAATTGLIRQAVRAAAVAAIRPSDVVAHVNHVLLPAEAPDSEQLHRLCTLCVLMVMPTKWGASVTLASAGHPLPLLATRGRTVRRIGTSGLLAGAFPGVHWTDVETAMSPGDVLLCFTDGVTERRNDGRFFEDDLERVVREASGSDATALVNAVRDRALAFSASAPTDDIALLAVRIPEAR